MDNDSNSLNKFFEDALRTALYLRLGLEQNSEIENYLLQLLTTFLREECLFAIRDENGVPVRTVTEMLEYGDIRLKASSFDQERIVHQHVGNLILFSSGLFPEILPHIGVDSSNSSLSNATRIGRDSYLVAGSFDHPPYTNQAKVLLKLGKEFEVYQEGLIYLRHYLQEIPGGRMAS